MILAFRKQLLCLTVLGFLFDVSFSTQVRAETTNNNEGPSFNCSGDLTAFEKAVCAEPELSALDRQLGVKFKEALLKRQADKQYIIKDQKEWLKRVESDFNSRSNSARIAFHYKSRLKYLSYPEMIKPLRPENIAAAVEALRNFGPEDFKDEDAEVSEELSCKLFEKYPTDAMAVFESMGGGMDGFMTICKTDTIDQKVPSIKRLIQAFEPAHGTVSRFCNGSIIETHFRITQTLLLLAAVDVHLQSVSELRRGNDQPLEIELNAAENYLKRWSQQGLWEKRTYEAIQKANVSTKKDLVSYYVSRFKVSESEAKVAADFFLGSILVDQIGPFPSDDPTANDTHCLTVRDLDGYLNSGTIPESICGVQDFTEEEKERAAVFSFLKIAIVENRPVEDFQTLLPLYLKLNVSKNLDDNFKLMLLDVVSKPKILKEFLAAGVDVNVANGFGKTPLMSAAQTHNSESIALLLQLGANVNFATKDTYPNEERQENCLGPSIGHRTALMYALWQGDIAAINLLLDAKADVTVKDSSNKTGLDYLEKNKKLSSVDKSKIKRRLLH
jgi:uncharacterized protein